MRSLCVHFHKLISVLVLLALLAVTLPLSSFAQSGGKDWTGMELYKRVKSGVICIR